MTFEANDRVTIAEDPKSEDWGKEELRELADGVREVLHEAGVENGMSLEQVEEMVELVGKRVVEVLGRANRESWG